MRTRVGLKYYLNYCLLSKEVKEKFGDNHIDNIFRPFDVLSNCTFTTSETMRDY